MSPNENIILAGDIGGTKTELGLFVMSENRPSLKVVESFSSIDHSGLDVILRHFLKSHPARIAGACFGIAGPVFKGQCRTTNLPWNVSEKALKKRFKWQSVNLINDLVAMARAIPVLYSREVYPLNGRHVRRGRNIGLIAPGTGLGEALLVFDRGEYSYVATEGGHCDFPIIDEKWAGLWRYLRKKYGHVSVERVVSGPGILNIYHWLKSSGKHKEPPWLKMLFRKHDPAGVISEAALKEKDPLCEETIDIFISSFGSVAGNLALTGMTRGGLFLGGGIAPKMLSRLKKGDFMESFTDKGRFGKFMESIPVKVITHKRPALLGAACCAFENAERGHSR